MTPVTAPEFHYDPFGPDVKADPLPFYKICLLYTSRCV